MVAPCNAQMRKVRHHADVADWKLLGTGRMVDGWVTPGLNPETGTEYDPADYAFDVEVYESVATPGKYKLASPWTSDKFPFLSKNEKKRLTILLSMLPTPTLLRWPLRYRDL